MDSCPGLYEELAISAVHHEVLSVDECAERTSMTSAEVVDRLICFRQRSRVHNEPPPLVGEGPNARLADGQCAVWEVVRMYRKLGSVDQLSQSFPCVRRDELEAALAYADLYPAEIEEQIERYEEVISRKKAEYPFSC